MEEDNVTDGSKHSDSVEGQKQDLAPKPSNAEDVESMQLDLKLGKNVVEDKPNTSIPAYNFLSKGFRWSYDDSIPQFGPKRFQGKGFSSTSTGSSDNSNESHYRLKESVIMDFSEPMLVDEADDDEKTISPSACPGDIELKQTKVEVIPSKDEILKNRSESFSEVCKDISPSEYLEDIEMGDNPAEWTPNEDYDSKNHSGSFSLGSKTMLASVNEFKMQQTSQKMVFKEANVLKYDLESTAATNQAVPPRERLDDILNQQGSFEIVSREDDELKNRTEGISEVTVAISPDVCLYDIETQKRKRENAEQFPNVLEIEKSTLISHAEDEFENIRTSLASECKKNMIHQEKSTKETRVVGGNRGKKRKQSDPDVSNKNIGGIRKAVRQNQEEDITLRRSERIRNYTMHALILDRPRRNKVELKSRLN